MRHHIDQRLLFVVAAVHSFTLFRLPVARAALAAGYDVHVAVPEGTPDKGIVEFGFPVHRYSISRRSLNPFREIWSILSLVRLYWRVRPNIVHLITIKPVLYGGIAARLAGVPAVVAAISGLGTVFVEHGPVALFIRAIVRRLYRFALGHDRLMVIFQNADDQAIVTELAGLAANEVALIRGGSGVDLRDYRVDPEPSGQPVVVMAARLLKQKGVVEYVTAARMLLDEGVQARFLLAGSPDPGNPSSLTPADLASIEADGAVTLVGFAENTTQLFSSAHIVALPSYREGLPKTLIEAAACGRPVVTTDVPGCRDAIVDGETGLLVPPKQVAPLKHALGTLIADPAMRQRMGRSGRRLAERLFVIDHVVGAHLDIYKRLSVQRSGGRALMR